jgi:tetratricopeptide (TPR) repeat protein
MAFILKYIEDKKLKYVLIAAIIFLCALLSKENTITFLGILPLVLLLFYSQNLISALKNTWPLFLATIIFMLMRTNAIGFGFGNSPMELLNNPYLKLSGNQYVPFTIGEKLATIFYTLGLYIKLLVFPHPLTHDYYPRHIEMMSFDDLSVILSFLIYIILFVLSMKWFKTKPLISFGILFYLITLSIVSNLFFPIGTNMSERFMFMPSVGFCFLAAYLFYLLSKKINNNLKTINYRLILSLTFLLAGLYSIKTISRNRVWESNYSLFTTDVKTSVNSAKLQNSVGGELIAKAGGIKDETEKNNLLNEAITHLNKAIAIHPTYHNAFLLLGNANFLLGNYDEAIKQYQNCLAINPGYKDALTNLHMVYREAGKYYGEKKNDLTTALVYLNKAFELNPDDYDTNRLLGVAYGIGNNHQKALEFFNTAAKINPSKEAFKNLSFAYMNAGDKINGDKYAQMASSIQEKK